MCSKKFLKFAHALEPVKIFVLRGSQAWGSQNDSIETLTTFPPALIKFVSLSPLEEIPDLDGNR